ncbi:hypothetical protein D3C79_950820 [compost metagenome]
MLKQRLRLNDDIPLDLPRINYEDNTVTLCGDDLSIRYRYDRRGVDDNHVVHLSRFGQKRLHLL